MQTIISARRIYLQIQIQIIKCTQYLVLYSTKDMHITLKTSNQAYFTNTWVTKDCNVLFVQFTCLRLWRVLQWDWDSSSTPAPCWGGTSRSDVSEASWSGRALRGSPPGQGTVGRWMCKKCQSKSSHSLLRELKPKSNQMFTDNKEEWWLNSYFNAIIIVLIQRTEQRIWAYCLKKNTWGLWHHVLIR